MNENVSHSSAVASGITKDISEVSVASRNISGRSNEVEEGAGELLKRAAELSKIVGRFKI